jgi:DNA polymerase I
LYCNILAMNKKVYLVDGSGYIFRAFYAIQSLRTKEGFPTNALYGFTRMLLKLLAAADSQHVVVVFDAGRETFRTEIYKDYKANRKDCPEDLLQQMPYFREIAIALGLQIIQQKGFEADDIIGTLAERLKKASIECVIVSGDKDMMQLVTDGVSIWDTMNDKRYGPNEVHAKMGVYPDKIIDLLALMGDSSDNIPGLKGAGPKTAVQLIEKYGNIENIINSAKLVAEDKSIRNRNKISEQIEFDAELIRLSQRLARIKTDVPCNIDQLGSEDKVMQSTDSDRSTVNISELSDDAFYAALERHAPNSSKIEELVQKFEFASLMKDFKLNLQPINQSPIVRNEGYRVVYSNDFPSWLELLKQQKEFSIDLETTSLDVHKAQIVGASFCWQDDKAYYLPLLHKDVQGQISTDVFLDGIASVLNDPSVKKIGQNLKYDFGVLAEHKIEMQGLYFDTMVAAYLLNPDRRTYNLTALSHDYLGKSVVEYDELVGDAQNFTDVDIDKACQYACQDAHFAWLLRKELEARINKDELGRVLYEIEMPLVPVLSRMERIGVQLDCEKLGLMSKEFEVELTAIQSQLYEMAGEEFNLNSPKQLAEILFNKLGLSDKGLKKTKTGVSTDASVLLKLSSQHPLPGLILRYRTLHKLKSTYIDTLPTQVSEITGRLHTRFNQTVTGTGRLSSSDPNLQNIPIQTAEGRRIREAFIAKPGCLLLSADYSQIELRILAHLSGDENLIEAFNQGIDIHSKTAREILNLSPEEELSDDLRRLGKTINFGVIYGMSGFRLGRELGIPVSTANKYIEEYFARYPRVNDLFAKYEREAEENGYVATLFGRRRVISALDISERDKGFSQRVAINAPIQGTAADIIKLAMINIDKLITKEQLQCKMLLQIHDELLFECLADDIDRVKRHVVDTMENVLTLSVPLKAACGMGKNWQEAHS